MNAEPHKRYAKRSERGSALLVVIFLVTVLLLSTMVVATNILTEGRREKEKEIIWRGNQYARGVKLHFRSWAVSYLPSRPHKAEGGFTSASCARLQRPIQGRWFLEVYLCRPAGQLIGSLKPPQHNILFPQNRRRGHSANALTPG